MNEFLFLVHLNIQTLPETIPDYMEMFFPRSPEKFMEYKFPKIPKKLENTVTTCNLH